ncbi:MAG: hypothetical protein M1830_005128 [Pleopsidium flavum]|nr:MAG: hypothetical protein M1830_005128 [Pleopsidium flavum]
MRTVPGKKGEPPDFGEILRSLVRVALAAGDIILNDAESARVKKASGVNGTVKEKLNSTDVVTETDEAVERMVMGELKAKSIGKESSVNEPLTDEPTFICDPVDGFMSSNFQDISAEKFLMTKRQHDELSVVVVCNPFYHHLYTAAPGKGAFFEDFRGRRSLPLTDPAPPLGRLCDSLLLVEWGKEREGINWETTTETFKNLGSKNGGMVHDLRMFGEKLFLQLKTGKEEETEAFLKKLRGAGDSNMVLGQSTEPLDRNYSDDLRNDSTYGGAGIQSSDGCTMANALGSLEAEYGSKQSEKDDQDGLPATLLDELSQVMSQLDIDEVGEVRYFGPSSNLNLVSDIPRVPAPPRTRDRLESVTSTLGMPVDCSSVNQEFAMRSVDSFTAGDDIGTGSYYGFGVPPSIYSSDPPSGFTQDYSAAQAPEDHLFTLYRTWQHPFFLLFSKHLFLRDMGAARAMKGAVGVR